MTTNIVRFPTPEERLARFANRIRRAFGQLSDDDFADLVIRAVRKLSPGDWSATEGEEVDGAGTRRLPG